MSENNKTVITDEMIRAAIYRELDSIETPPVEAAWQRLQERRADAAPAAASHRARPWTRYSALAAALLLFFFGGYGVYRTYSDSPHRALLVGSPESDGVDLLATHENDKIEVFSDSLADWDRVDDSRDAQGLPDTLNGYSLEATFTKEAKSGVLYLAALYTRGDLSLVWLQSDVASRDQFITDLEYLLQVPLQPPTLEDTRASLSVNAFPALIWEKEGRHFLLWDLSGSTTEADLHRLIP
jgi:hypothetical protein